MTSEARPGDGELNAAIKAQRTLLSENRSIVALHDDGRIVRYHRNGSITPIDEQ